MGADISKSKIVMSKLTATAVLFIAILSSGNLFCQSKLSDFSSQNSFGRIGLGPNIVIHNSRAGSNVFGFGFSVYGGHSFTDNLSAKAQFGYTTFVDDSDTQILDSPSSIDAPSDLDFTGGSMHMFSADLILRLGISSKQRFNPYLALGVGMAFESQDNSYVNMSAGGGINFNLNSLGTSLNLEALYNSSVNGNFPIRLFLAQTF